MLNYMLFKAVRIYFLEEKNLRKYIHFYSFSETYHNCSHFEKILCRYLSEIKPKYSPRCSNRFVHPRQSFRHGLEPTNIQIEKAQPETSWAGFGWDNVHSQSGDGQGNHDVKPHSVWMSDYIICLEEFVLFKSWREQ